MFHEVRNHLYLLTPESPILVTVVGPQKCLLNEQIICTHILKHPCIIRYYSLHFVKGETKTQVSYHSEVT